jgi:DNA-binding response OmpR family regulator
VHVLLIEDDTEAARFLVKGLRESGYSVDHAADGREGLFRATEGQFDLVVTDRMLPHIDGLAIIELMRRKGLTTPVLVLSALGSVDDRVKGLKAGGDDYLTKPFAFAELVARVRSLGRRARPALPPVLERAGITLDLPGHRAWRDGLLLSLSPKEFAVLEVLMRAGGTVVSAEELLEKAWDENADPFTNAVRVALMTLRRKLGDPPVIETVPGAGYRLGP